MTNAQAISSGFYGRKFDQTAATAEPAAERPPNPSFEIKESRYAVRLARTPEEIDAALRLRFEVFNVELGEGLDASFITGRDEDRFDAACHHLIVLENETGAVVGTYRLQTLEMAGLVSNFYCAGEFELENLPPAVLARSLEIGRACIAREHRNTRVLYLLWKGLTRYAAERRKRYFFGCCSLNTQNPLDGLEAERFLARGNHFRRDFYLFPRPDYRCGSEDFAAAVGPRADFELPKLFHTYLRFGAEVCSRPAIDREFKTIDFLVIFDLEAMNEKLRRLFDVETRFG